MIYCVYNFLVCRIYFLFYCCVVSVAPFCTCDRNQSSYIHNKEYIQTLTHQVRGYFNTEFNCIDCGLVSLHILEQREV